MGDDESRLPAGPDSLAAMGYDIERRGEPRDPLGTRATLIFGKSAVGCTVLNVSTSGAKISLDSMAIVPRQLILQFDQGDAFEARRLWSLGDQMGLLFDRSAPLIRGTTNVAAAALAALPADGLDGCLRILRAAGFLDDHDLRDSARQAEGAYTRFRGVLGGLVRREG